MTLRASAQDIFAYADQKMPKTGGAFTGGVSGVSPTSGSTKGFRNIYIGSGAPASSLGPTATFTSTSDKRRTRT